MSVELSSPIKLGTRLYHYKLNERDNRIFLYVPILHSFPFVPLCLCASVPFFYTSAFCLLFTPFPKQQQAVHTDGQSQPLCEHRCRMQSAGPICWEPVCIHPMTCFPIIPTIKPKTAPSGGIQCRRILDFGAMS